MSTRRESWYWCTFTSTHGSHNGLVRAWNPQSAAAQFAEEVRAETGEEGTVCVEPGWGHLDRSRDSNVERGDALDPGGARSA